VSTSRWSILKFLGVVIFEAVLILRAAYRAFYRESWTGLHVERYSRDRRYSGFQTADHVACAYMANVKGFQVDEYACRY